MILHLPSFGRRCGVLVVLCTAALSSAGAEDSIVVTDRVVGRTPSIIGINTGEMPRGSAFPEWVGALGVNGARLRLGIKPAASGDSRAASGTDFAHLEKSLRSNAEIETTKLWQHPEGVAASSLDALRRRDIELLATITCPFSFQVLGPDGRIDWSRAWSFWEAYYAQAYQLARQHQVRRYQLFNEPDHAASMKLTQEEYSARLRIGTDAIQSALADVSKRTGKPLLPLISAPCTASIKAFASRGRPDTRDPLIGWGELTMRDRHVRLSGENDPSYSQIQQYAYQQYSINPTNFLGQLDELRNQIQAANGNLPFPIVMTEFNVHTAASFSKLETTLDSPKEFSGLGAMSTALAESGLEEMYFFRLTLSWDGENKRIKKNGLHHVNEDIEPPEITGTTRAAEVIRLAANALAGGRDRLEIKGCAAIRTAATRTRGETDLLLANTNDAGIDNLEVVLPALGRPVLNTFQYVSEKSFGTVSILDSKEGIHLSLPPQSFGELSSREVKSLTPITIPSSSSFSSSAAGHGKLLTGGRDAAHTLLEFKVPRENNAIVFLHLKRNSSAVKPVPLHLYASDRELPPKADLQVGKLPFRRMTAIPSGQAALTIEGLGRGLELAGGFTVDPGTGDTWIEITRAVQRRTPGKEFSLLLTRDIRTKDDTLEAEPVEWISAEMVVYSGA